jgi:hypothetical protein
MKAIFNAALIAACGILFGCLDSVFGTSGNDSGSTEYVVTREEQGHYSFVGDTTIRMLDSQERVPGADWEPVQEDTVSRSIRNISEQSFEITMDPEEGPGEFTLLTLVESEEGSEPGAANTKPGHAST